VDALRFLVVFLAGLPAGGLLVVLFYALALPTLPPEYIAKMHARLHPPTHRSMQTATIVAALLAIALALWDDPSWRASTVLLFVGLVGPAAQAILSRFWVVPMSDEIIGWADGGAPADYPAFLRKWAILHSGRVAGAIVAFACYLLAVILTVT
jgi:hypothetical protein